MKRKAIEGEPSPEYKGVMENMYAGEPYDQTFHPGIDDAHWLDWYLEKYKKNFPGQKNVYPQLEDDMGMPTVGSYHDAPRIVVGDADRLAGLIRGYDSIYPGFALYMASLSPDIASLKTSISDSIYRRANPDPSTWTDTKINNENEFGNRPVSKNEPGQEADSIMGQDLDRVVSNIERLKRTKKRRPPN